MSSNETRIPLRSEVAKQDQWDLSSLYADAAAWEQDHQNLRDLLPQAGTWRSTLAQDGLLPCLDYQNRVGLLVERLSTWAYLRFAENGDDPEAQKRLAMIQRSAMEFSAAMAWVDPEILEIAPARMDELLQTAGDYRIALQKLLRTRPHVLPADQERLLSLHAEAHATARKAFSALTDVDMVFGTVATPEGERPLSQSSYQSLLQHPDRQVRERANTQFMEVFAAHQNTLANLYIGSINLDRAQAVVRNHATSRDAALFYEAVPAQVYDNLVASVESQLPVLHRYYELRRKKLGLERLRMFDTKVPLVGSARMSHTWDQAVDLVCEAVAPLGKEYGDTLRRGLADGWADRYENKGKRSGAFSYGTFHGKPYILMNYKSDLLRDVFTLAHEAGHSMHSWYSVRNNPFSHYHYTIFEAEVASTVNEQLLFQHLMAQDLDKDVRLFLVNSRVDDIIATLFRQTMFASYEQICHAYADEGRPLSLAALRTEYQTLLARYFGPALQIAGNDDLEGLRIPHFYRAFYVYKYATGISAALALAQGILGGGASARDAYLAFLSSGGSRYPLDSLRLAGVDMGSPGPVKGALSVFSGLLDQLEAVL